MILEPKKIKSNTVSTVSPCVCHEVMGPDASPITSHQINGETMETVSDFVFLGSKITADGDYTMKLKDAYSLEGKL